MLKRYTFWLSAAVLFQFITAILHSLSLFINVPPSNDTEAQLQTLVTTYHLNAGAGFAPTYSDLFTALSSCFTFLCLFAGLTNGYLLLKHAEPNLMKGILAINVAIFGVVFLVMAVFTFLPPIFCTGVIFANLLAAYLVVPKIETTI